MPCDFEPWSMIARSKTRFNRTATTTAAQETFSLKTTQVTTADTRPVSTLETFPYSYATGILWYQIDYWRQTPQIAAGASADDDILNDVEDDLILAYLAEALGAHLIADGATMERSWFLAREFLHRALKNAGIPAHKISLPPPFIMRDPDVNTRGE